jgi:hypothetical protein
MLIKCQDNIIQSHQPTARRFTWEDERVPAPGLNLKIDWNQSFQTTAEKWPNRKLMSSIVSSNSAQLAQSTKDQCRTNEIKTPAISTNVSMCFATISTKPISSQSDFRRHYKLVATWMLMRTTTIKAHIKPEQIRHLSGSRSNISGQITLKSSKSKPMVLKKRKNKPMSNIQKLHS